MRTWLVLARGERSQREIAVAAGIRQGYYSMIENGQRRPSVEVAKRIGCAAGVDWRRFFEESGEKRGRENGNECVLQELR